MTQVDLISDGHAEAEQRYRLHDADFTPTPVVRQLWDYLKGCVPSNARVLSPTAGAGVFTMVARERLPQCRTCAIELRQEEERYLNVNSDRYVIGDALEVLAGDVGEFDLVTENPAFSITPALLPSCLKVVRRHGLVVFMGINSLSQRGEESSKLFSRFPPRFQLRVQGAIDFRGGQINPKSGRPFASDARCYSWWVFESDGRGGCIAAGHGWRAMDLDWLPGHMRRWRGTRPGTEVDHA